ncbi:MAG: 30S ribosomal protein S1 [Candidatus Marinimicrobia bacterium]|nr:30S ribosomal protein S1 [Candidatus Neomarinimicrobiota bacterium]|tara:strand:- start:31699 stop:33477 length:1779 start_codon:yes stop_codon:yes gene_type:complete
MTNEQIENVENVKSKNDLSNDNVIISHDVKNYLDAKILNVKSYNFEEISKIDKKIDLSNNELEESEIYNKNIVELNEKQLVKGTVVSLNNKEVLVDIGFKSEGTISLSEFEVIPAIGQEIDVFLVVFEDRHGRLILSKERAEFEKKWMSLRSAASDETIIKGTILKRIKGGMVVDLNGINAFLPGSQIDVKPVSDFDSYLNQEFEFKIVKFNELRQNIVVSRKAIMSENSDVNKKEIFDSIEKGMEIDGIVKNITDFGAFIDLGSGVDGLLHITDITWGRINHPSDKLSIGDKIKVKIIDIDVDKSRLSLGTKQLSQNPWDKIQDNFKEGDKVKGKIVNIMNYGVFIEIEEGIEGLVHISEFSWTKHIKHPADIYKVGDKVETIILSIDQENKKISLGVKQLIDNPWVQVESKYKVDEVYNGKISSIVQSGVYVQISDEIEGFVNNEDISWTRKLKSANNIFKQNDEVKVKVLDVVASERKLSLGIKHTSDDPWLNINDFFEEKSTVKGTVLFSMDKGVVVLLDNDFEGIVPASKIKNSVTDYQTNDILSLNIEEINADNRRIVLSIDDKSEESEDSSSEENKSLDEQDKSE